MYGTIVFLFDMKVTIVFYEYRFSSCSHKVVVFDCKHICIFKLNGLNLNHSIAYHFDRKYNKINQSINIQYSINHQYFTIWCFAIIITFL